MSDDAKISEERLLPCPFCGTPNPQLRRDEIPFQRGNYNGFVVACQCAVTAWGPTADEAAFSWNRRAAQQPQPAADPSTVAVPVAAMEKVREALNDMTGGDALGYGYRIGGMMALVKAARELVNASPAAPPEAQPVERESFEHRIARADEATPNEEKVLHEWERNGWRWRITDGPRPSGIGYQTWIHEREEWAWQTGPVGALTHELLRLLALNRQLDSSLSLALAQAEEERLRANDMARRLADLASRQPVTSVALTASDIAPTVAVPAATRTRLRQALDDYESSF